MKDPPRAAPRTVDEYLANVPPAMRAALEELRTTIREAAPAATEVIRYQIPTFRHHGNLVHYAAFRDHCSFFPGSLVTVRKFAKELKPFRAGEAGKGTVHFTPDHSLPASLVTQIVLARVAENEVRAAGKVWKGPRKPTKTR